MTMASCRCFICCLYVLQCGSFISLICVLWWREACRRSQPATFSSTPSSFFHPSGCFPLLIMSAHKTAAGSFLSQLPPSEMRLSPLSLSPSVCLSFSYADYYCLNLWYALLCNYPPPLPSSPPFHIKHMITFNKPIISIAARSRAGRRGSYLVQQISDHSPAHFKPFRSHEKSPLRLLVSDYRDAVAKTEWRGATNSPFPPSPIRLKTIGRQPPPLSAGRET